MYCQVEHSIGKLIRLLDMVMVSKRLLYFTILSIQSCSSFLLSSIYKAQIHGSLCEVEVSKGIFIFLYPQI
jgi:hypothetical protein